MPLHICKTLHSHFYYLFNLFNCSCGSRTEVAASTFLSLEKVKARYQPSLSYLPPYLLLYRKDPERELVKGLRAEGVANCMRTRKKLFMDLKQLPGPCSPTCPLSPPFRDTFPGLEHCLKHRRPSLDSITWIFLQTHVVFRKNSDVLEI